MSVNSSNSSLPPYTLPSSHDVFHFLRYCISSTVGSFIITPFTITSILFLLPLCILILYLGQQRWRQQCSRTAMSHSDLFTYHMVVMELMGILGSILSFCALLTDLIEMIKTGIILFSINIVGQTFFHILTCVERYLAVVHPVTYLGLRKASGIRIRNITIGCVWLLCFAWTGFVFIQNTISLSIVSLFTIALALIIISFCSLSVLCVLIRSGPGEGGGSRQQVHQSKLRAFYTIMAILGVLAFRFTGNIVTAAMYISPQLGVIEKCGLWMSTMWCSLPSSLVLPLLFLHRAGKLPSCKNNTEPGRGSE